MNYYFLGVSVWCFGVAFLIGLVGLNAREG